MSSFAPSPFRPALYHAEPSWRQDFSPHTSMLAHQWPNPNMPHISGMQHLDVRLFADEEQQHFSDLSNYSQQPDAWSDMETVGTPSTSGYAHESPDAVFNPHPAPSMHLQLPNEQSNYILPPAASPQSSYGSVSPTPSPMSMPLDDRAFPTNRQILSSQTQSRKSTKSPSSTASVGRAGMVGEIILGSHDEEAEYIPASANDAKRSRKRARIPHTAVERRYRENLNAHLDKLRQNVPTLATRKGPEAGKMSAASTGGESVKPSKCEILNGAIEHIGSLGRENEALKNEVSMLRAKVVDYDAWCRANLR